MLTAPSRKPIVGESTMNSSSMPQPQPNVIACSPDLAIAAPAMPPTKACEELVGRASSQVMMFQTIAPVSPPQTTQMSIAFLSTSPLPIVAATPVPNANAATKLKNAAQ